MNEESVTINTPTEGTQEVERTIRYNAYPDSRTDGPYAVGIREMSVTYAQHADNADPNLDCEGFGSQTLKFSTVESDDLDEPYYILSTDRWAFESVDELMSIVKDFILRSRMENKTKITV